MKIIELYKSILTAGSLTADDEGMVSASIGSTTTPFMVEGKRLVLPTPQHLANPDWAGRVVFHPLSENIMRGESKVMGKFRWAINLRMNFVIGCVAQELLEVVTSVATHRRLSPDQAEILSKVKDADEKDKDGKSKTMAVFQSLLKSMGMDNKDKCFVHIFLKRGGTVNGKKYDRASIVTFPLYEELQKTDKQVYGVTMSNKQKLAIKQLLEFILPGIETPHHFDRGSESDIAPFLDCLMGCVMGLAGRINTTIATYEEFVDSADTYMYPDDWVETFDNLAQLLPEIRSIPMQAGNEGAVSKTAHPTPVAHQLQNVQSAQPVHAGAPQHHGSIPMPAVLPNPYPQQVQQYMPPMQQAAGPVKTETGAIDFAASMRVNPQLAASMSYNPYGGGGYPGMAPPIPPGPVASRMGAPRWDQPVNTGWPQQGGYQQPGWPQGGGYQQNPQGGFRGI